MKAENVIIKTLTKLEDIVLIFCLGIMGIVLFSQVVFRYFFSIPLMWNEELSRYLQIWIAFLGIGYGIRNNSHISMTLFVKKLPVKAQAFVGIITNLIMIACFAYFLPGATRFVIDQNQISSSAMQVKMSIVYFVAPFGGFIYICYTLADTYIRIKSLFWENREIY